MEKDPARRFPDAASMGRALREAAGVSDADESGEIPRASESGAHADPPPVGISDLWRVPNPGAATLGGTSRELAAELLPPVSGDDERGARWAVVALVACLLVVAAAGWIFVVGQRAPRTVPSAVGPPASEPEPAPGGTSAAVTGALQLRASGELSEALRRLDEALLANGELAEAHHARAAILASQGRAEEAVRALDAYLGLQPDVTALATQIQGDADLLRLGSSSSFQRWAAERKIPLAASEPGGVDGDASAATLAGPGEAVTSRPGRGAAAVRRSGRKRIQVRAAPPSPSSAHRGNPLGVDPDL